MSYATMESYSNATSTGGQEGFRLFKEAYEVCGVGAAPKCTEKFRHKEGYVRFTEAYCENPAGAGCLDKKEKYDSVMNQQYDGREDFKDSSCYDANNNLLINKPGCSENFQPKKERWMSQYSGSTENFYNCPEGQVPGPKGYCVNAPQRERWMSQYSGSTENFRRTGRERYAPNPVRENFAKVESSPAAAPAAEKKEEKKEKSVSANQVRAVIQAAVNGDEGALAQLRAALNYLYTEEDAQKLVFNLMNGDAEAANSAAEAVELFQELATEEGFNNNNNGTCEVKDGSFQRCTTRNHDGVSGWFGGKETKCVPDSSCKNELCEAAATDEKRRELGCPQTGQENFEHEEDHKENFGGHDDHEENPQGENYVENFFEVMFS